MMGMAESTLYICDLDGTLLRSDATLSDFARDGLNRLIDAGARLTVASARGTRLRLRHAQRLARCQQRSLRA